MLEANIHKHTLRVTVVVSRFASNLGIEAKVKGRATLHAGNAISVAQAQERRMSDSVALR